MNDVDEWDLYAEEEQQRYDELCEVEMQLEREREELREQQEIENIEAAVEGQMKDFCRGYEFGENYEQGNHEKFWGDFWGGFLAGAKKVKEKQESEQLKQEEEEKAKSNDDDSFNLLLALGVFALQIATLIKLSVI